MRKLFFQAVLSLACFGAIWWGLSQLPWVKWLHVKEASQKKERKLSELTLKLYSRDARELKSGDVRMAIDSIRNKICLANNIDTSEVHIHVFEGQEINAYAIPMGHIIVYSELINYCNDPDMLAGIMAHEIAHIQLRHIRSKLMKEVLIVGVAALVGENTGILGGILRTLTSTAFDRGQEEDADATAVTYLQKAQIDPKPMAEFLKKLSVDNKWAEQIPDWVSTHPNSQSRAQNILSTSKKTNSYNPSIDSTTWQKLKHNL